MTLQQTRQLSTHSTVVSCCCTTVMQLFVACTVVMVTCGAGRGTAGRRSNRKTKQVEACKTEALVEGTDEGALVTVTKKKSRAKAVSTGPVFGTARCYVHHA